MKRLPGNAEVPHHVVLQARDQKPALLREQVQAHAPVLVHAALPRVSLTPDDAAVAAGVSRTRIFDAIRKGKLIARGDGKATIIEVRELVNWVASLPVKGPLKTT